MSSDNPLSIENQNLLLEVARASICYGVQHQHEQTLSLDDFEPALQQQRASFVTLHLNHELRGCIGTLEAYQPLVLDVAHNAYAAAFTDPRFMPVTADELDSLELHISIINPSEEMQFKSEQDLIKQIRPGIDGLIMQDERNRGTFLPSVWEQLPDPTQFIQHLKLKAGLPANFWSASLRVWRYTTISFP